MPLWAELTEGQREYYLAFHAPIENNVPEQPGNNTDVPVRQINPTEGQYNTMRETGSALVRTINYRLNENQRNAVAIWLDENPNIRDEYVHGALRKKRRSSKSRRGRRVAAPRSRRRRRSAPQSRRRRRRSSSQPKRRRRGSSASQSRRRRSSSMQSRRRREDVQTRRRRR